MNLDHSTERLWSFRAKQTDGELEYKTYFFTSSEGETQVREYPLMRSPSNPYLITTIPADLHA